MQLDKRISKAIEEICNQKGLNDLAKPLIRFVVENAEGNVSDEALSTRLDGLYALIDISGDNQ